MLKVVHQVSLRRATNPEHGNVQTFLEQLLVEVISGNYRYFLNEHLTNSIPEIDEPEAYCWPPLLANERQVSGLFANALASVCPVSRPEFAILRPGESGHGGVESSGRVDFFATYGRRSLALELKQIPISSLGEAGGKRVMNARWNTLVKQSGQALAYLRKDPRRYPHPVSVGLLVIRVSRKVARRKTADEVRSAASDQMDAILQSVKSSIKPDFLAHYVPPLEMQAFLGWGESGDEYRVFPGVIFAAVVHGKQPPKNR